MLGDDWADAMHDQSDILGNAGLIYRAYPRHVKVGDADCYPLLIFFRRQTGISHRSISNHVQDWCRGRDWLCQWF